MPDQHHHQVTEPRHAGDDGRVLPECAVAVQLDEVVEDEADVVERVRPLEVARELDDLPGVASHEPLGLRDGLLAVGLRQSRGERCGVRSPGLLDPRVELEEVPDRARQVLARLDQIEHPVLHQEAGRLEAVGQLLRGSSARSPTGPAKPMCAPGSATSTSPSVANEALTPP